MKGSTAHTVLIYFTTISYYYCIEIFRKVLYKSGTVTGNIEFTKNLYNHTFILSFNSFTFCKSSLKIINITIMN